MGKINAKVFSLVDGYDALSDLKSIKIKSSKYNLLIMEDYLPVIGEVDGDVTFVTDNDEIKLEKINGYYRHSHNEFELLIKSDNND